MNYMLKRYISFTLTFVLFLSLLTPFSAQAENSTELGNENIIENIGDETQSEGKVDPGESVPPTIEDTEKAEKTEKIEETAEQGDLTEHVKPTVNEKLVESIEKVKEFYNNNNKKISNIVISSHSGYWSLTAMYALGIDVQKYQWEPGFEITSEHSFWVKPKTAASSTSNEDAGTIIGAYILGLDPTNLGQRNIVEDLQNKQQTDGSFSTAYGESWASIALGLANADYNKAKHLEVILKKQNSSGLFSGFGSSDDLDVTGWDLTALTLLNNADNSNETINESIKKAVDGIHAKYQKDGFVNNTNSMASIIMGLAAVGEDLTTDKWSYEKDGQKVNILEKMIDDYQLEDGSFKWMIKDTKTNMMATEQVAIALADAYRQQSIFAELKSADIPELNNPKPIAPENIDPLKKYTIPVQINKLNDIKPDAFKEVIAKTDFTAIIENKKINLSIKLNKLINKIELKQGNTFNSLECSDLTCIQEGLAIDQEIVLKVHYTDSTARALKGTDLAQEITLSLDTTKIFEIKEPDNPTTPPTGGGGATNPPIDGGGSTEQTGKVSFSIAGLFSNNIAIHESDSVYSVLDRVTKENNISITAKGSSMGIYVSMIGGLSEFDRGPLSGWMYSVNGILPNVSSDKLIVKAGDRIEWFYTIDGKNPSDVKPGTPEENGVTPVLSTAIKKNADYLLATTQNPEFGNEWAILTLARSGQPVPKGYFEKYYKAVENHIISKKGILDTRKYTEYSRLIIALAAIGKDPANVGGNNLLEKLADYDQVVSQGINGPIFALIALDSYGYGIPKGQGNIQTTRENLVQYILDKELPNGGFNLSGTVPNADMTAMAIQALAPYSKNDKKVQNTIDRAVNVLTTMQLSNGGYLSDGIENLESTAQVLTALSIIGINIDDDSRFIKEDKATIYSAMMKFYLENGAFAHTGKTPNKMATEQGSYALVAYKRLLNKENSIYNMSDVISVQPITNNDTEIKGKAAIGSTVFVKNGDKEIGSAVVATDGSYTVKISALEENTILTIYAVDDKGKKGLEHNVTVIDKNGPTELTVGTISNKTTSVTGTTEANAKVSIYNGTKLLASTKANSKGTFTLKIPAQKANVKLVVKTTDEAGNAGVTKTITVLDKIGPTKLTVGTISNKTTSVKGTTEAKATVSIYKGSKLLTTTKASSKGNYTLKISKQKANVKLVVKTKDTVGNKGVTKTITVKDKIAPKKPTVSKITSKTTKVKGKTEAKATITIYNSKHKKIGSAKASSKGNFSVKIKKQKANTKLSIYAKDEAGIKSSKLRVKVK